MKKFLLPFVALSIILTSCSRDNDDVINYPISNPVAQGDLLVEITDTENSYPAFNPRFIYNEDKLQESKGGDGDMSFTYDGEQITNISRSKGHYLGNWSTKYSYNPDGTLLYSKGVYKDRFRTTNPIAMYEIETIREYTYAGNIVKVKETIKSSSDLSPDVRTTITEHSFTLDSNGNIVKKMISSDLGHTTTTTFTYDNKINPLGKIKGLAALNIEFSLGDGPNTFFYMNGNKNNILSKKIEGGNEEVYEYEYNSKGYPLKRKSTKTDSGITNVHTYNYK